MTPSILPGISQEIKLQIQNKTAGGIGNAGGWFNADGSTQILLP
ncbi:MAG: hypothetical protein WCA49_19995 [Candidatus Sulfotelmatobacter sp.]